VTVTLVSFHYS